MQEKKILNTWKEVAQYVGRSTRTIQRWEKELGFPIHRPGGKEGSGVLAIPSEIDQWARETPRAGVQGFKAPTAGHSEAEITRLQQVYEARRPRHRAPAPRPTNQPQPLHGRKIQGMQ